MKTIKYPGSIVRKSLACATYYNVPIAQEMRTFTLRTDRRVAAPVPTPAPVPRSSHTPSEGARAACRCACGGGCPRCTAALQAKLFVGSSHDPLEQEADRVAEQVLAGPATPGVRRAPPGIQRAAHVAPGAAGVSPRSVDHVLAGQGSPLPSGVQNDMSQRFGHDFSHVRIHTGSLAEASARDVHAKAYTVGHNVVFGAGQYAPDARQGQQLLAHELTHVLQQSGGTSAPYLARSVDDWLAGTVNIAAMTYTQLLAEVDELAQYLDRQTSTSPESARIEQALVSLRAEVNRREVATADPRSRGRGRRAAAAPASDAPLPSRYPRILTEMTSVAYADPAEMRAEYDLIMQWLTRREIGANERRILTAERDSLGPQLRSDRQRVVAERHAARLTTALSPSDEDAHALETMARTIQGISREQGDVFYIHHQGERIRISRDQAAQLRQNLATQLQRAAQSIDSRAQYYWDRYHSQLAINRDSPIIAGISGWLGDVEDPLEELSARYYWVYHRVRAIRAQLQADHLVEAAAMIPPVDFVGGEIGELAKAFYDGLIEGADIARQRLEFTRDASFALAGSIAAVVAAPVVAGFVGAGGLGATGITATVLTTGGTGLVVGTGTAVVRGSSAATGTLAAGGSLDEIGAAFRGEAIRGFREGFINGGAGAAARLLGPALGVGTSLGQQALRRVATEAIVNGTSAMVDVLWQGGTDRGGRGGGAPRRRAQCARCIARRVEQSDRSQPGRSIHRRWNRLSWRASRWCDARAGDAVGCRCRHLKSRHVAQLAQCGGRCQAGRVRTVEGGQCSRHGGHGHPKSCVDRRGGHDRHSGGPATGAFWIRRNVGRDRWRHFQHAGCELLITIGGVTRHRGRGARRHNSSCGYRSDGAGCPGGNRRHGAARQHVTCRRYRCPSCRAPCRSGSGDACGEHDGTGNSCR